MNEGRDGSPSRVEHGAAGTGAPTATEPCPECGAQNPIGQRFCMQCGVRLGVAPATGGRRRCRGAAAGDAAERALARQEFGRIKSVVLTVRDDGPGVHAAPSRAGSGSGIGLGNLRARLERLYGDGFELALVDDPRGGACVTVVVPSARVA